MNAENYKISKLSYIENGSNEIMKNTKYAHNMKRNRPMGMLYIPLL